MSAQDCLIETRHGRFAVRDYGGEGPPLLLVHGTGHNLEVWTPLAAILRDRFHILAFDMRGHGRTEVDSTDAERYWRDIGDIIASVGVATPVLVGHSTGAYAVAAHAAAGGACAGLALLDGFVLDARPSAEAAKSKAFDRRSPWKAWRLGWSAREEEMHRWITSQAVRAARDGLPPDVMATMMRRAFRAGEGVYLRRPTLDDLEAVCGNDPADTIYPERGLYSRIRHPMLFLLASRGPYAKRRFEIESLAEQGAGRCFAVIDAGHNLHLERPAEVGRIIAQTFGKPFG